MTVNEVKSYAKNRLQSLNSSISIQAANLTSGTRSRSITQPKLAWGLSLDHKLIETTEISLSQAGSWERGPSIALFSSSFTKSERASALRPSQPPHVECLLGSKGLVRQASDCPPGDEETYLEVWELKNPYH